MRTYINDLLIHGESKVKQILYTCSFPPLCTYSVKSERLMSKTTFCCYKSMLGKERKRERERGGGGGGRGGGQPDRQRQTQVQTHRHKQSQTDIHTNRQTNRKTSLPARLLIYKTSQTETNCEVVDVLGVYQRPIEETRYQTFLISDYSYSVLPVRLPCDRVSRNTKQSFLQVSGITPKFFAE